MYNKKVLKNLPPPPIIGKVLLQKQILAIDGRMHDGNGLMAMAENSIDFWQQQPSELVGLPP